jgi:hypothetical protein
MAKQTTTPPAEKAARRFTVKHPTIINGHCCGVLIKDSVGETADAIKAHAAQEFGCEVLDAATGKAAWPKEDPAAKPAEKK